LPGVDVQAASNAAALNAAASPARRMLLFIVASPPEEIPKRNLAPMATGHGAHKPLGEHRIP
jgi:hypothetical protein